MLYDLTRRNIYFSTQANVYKGSLLLASTSSSQLFLKSYLPSSDIIAGSLIKVFRIASHI